MTIKDVIQHLHTLPPDMEVWVTWDESGEYWPATKPQGRVDWIVQQTRSGKTRWEASYQDGKGKSVCVLLSNPGHQETTHLVRRTLDGVVGRSESKEE